MPYHIKLSELGRLSRDEQETEFKSLTRASIATPNGTRAIVTDRIREFERRYEMKSAQLLEGLEQGTVRETADIAEWVFWLDTRDHSVAR